jgi:uncharacterized protein (DUF1330 family)
MPAYIIAEIEVTDPETYAGYREMVAPTLAAYGGRFLVRGGAAEALEGEPPGRVVIVEFADVEQAKAWWDSPEYRAARELRRRAANSRLIVVEGLA